MKEKENLLEVENLSVSFTQYASGSKRRTIEVIHDISLSVKSGEILAVIGASGSGKSLLAHAIMGILPINAKTGGTIKYKGNTLDDKLKAELRGKEIALIPQSVSYLDPLLNVKNQISSPLEKQSRKEKQAFVSKLLKKFQLEKKVSEQLPDGSYITTVMYWYQFANMELGVVGYCDFTNIANYANLKGITDPRTYLETIKADKYATSLKYVDNVMNVINKYGLTKYDPVQPPAPVPPTPTPTSGYVWNGMDYTPVFNPNFYALRYGDLKAAFGTNATLLFSHFTMFGMNEARQAAEVFDPIAYRNRYSDLNKAFGDNWPKYYEHYIMFGIKENRNGKHD